MDLPPPPTTTTSTSCWLSLPSPFLLPSSLSLPPPLCLPHFFLPPSHTHTHTHSFSLSLSYRLFYLASLFSSLSFHPSSPLRFCVLVLWFILISTLTSPHPNIHSKPIFSVSWTDILTLIVCMCAILSSNYIISAAIRRPVDRDFPFRFEEHVKRKVSEIRIGKTNSSNYQHVCMRFYVYNVWYCKLHVFCM